MTERLEMTRTASEQPPSAPSRKQARHVACRRVQRRFRDGSETVPRASVRPEAARVASCARYCEKIYVHK